MALNLAPFDFWTALKRRWLALQYPCDFGKSSGDCRARTQSADRPVNALDDDERELGIGRDARGYVALYRDIAEIDTVFVLALRGQHEAGYTNP